METQWAANDVMVKDGFAYVAATFGGLNVIDVRDPSDPRIVGAALAQPGTALGVVLSDDLVYQAAGEGGLQIFPLQCGPALSVESPDARDPARFTARLSVIPNPASGIVRIRFAGDGFGPMQAEIYDAGGRLVRRLSTSTGNAQAREVCWDGRDALGRRVPAGIYLVRASAETTQARARLTILR